MIRENAMRVEFFKVKVMPTLRQNEKVQFLVLRGLQTDICGVLGQTRALENTSTDIRHFLSWLLM